MASPAPAPSPEERTNFFRVCRVVLDHIPEVLRTFFKERVQSRLSHTWDDTPTSGNWLVTHPRKNVTKGLMSDQTTLLKGGQTEKWDPTLLFHVLRSSTLRLLVDEIPGATLSVQQSEVSLPVGSPLLSSIVPGCRVLFDDGKKSEYRKISSITATQLILKSKVTVKPAGVKVYLCTPEFEAVGQLRELRNVCFAHKFSAIAPTVELDDLLEKVEKAYGDLSVSSEEIETLKEIKTEPIVDDTTFAEYRRRIEELLKQSLYYDQHIEGLERRFDEMESKLEVSDRQVVSQDQRIEENTLALGEAIDLGRRVSQHVEELDIRHTKSDERLLRLEDKVDTLSQQTQSSKGNTPVQVMIGQAATVNVYNRPSPARPTDHLSSIPRPTVSSRAILNDIPNPEFCSVIQSRGGGSRLPGHIGQSLAPIAPAVTQPVMVLKPASSGAAEVVRCSPGGKPTYEEIQRLNCQYDYVEDYSRSRYMCTIKYSIDGRPHRVDSGGYHATKQAAREAAEIKLPRIRSRGEAAVDHKAELRHYYVEVKGIEEPNITYRTREVSRRGYQSTVYAPGMGYIKGDYCKSRDKAEHSAADKMLQEIKMFDTN